MPQCDVSIIIPTLDRPAYLAACGAVEARLRIVVTPGAPGGSPTIALIAQPAQRPTTPAICEMAEPRLSLGGVGSRKLLARIEYRLARERAEAAGADVGLIVDSYGLCALVADRGSAAELLACEAGDEVCLSKSEAADDAVASAVSLSPRERPGGVGARR